MRKKGKKEIIVKTVFTGIFIFMLWWAFLMWERFTSNITLEKPIDEISMLLVWYDIQNRRYIPTDANIQSFDLVLNNEKEIMKFSFTVQGEKKGEMLAYTYQEQKGEKRIFEQTAIEKQVEKDLQATTFFRAIQVLQVKQKLTEGIEILFKNEGLDRFSQPSRMWKIEDEQLIEIHQDLEGNQSYKKLLLISGEEVEWVYVLA